MFVFKPDPLVRKKGHTGKVHKKRPTPQKKHKKITRFKSITLLCLAIFKVFRIFWGVGCVLVDRAVFAQYGPDQAAETTFARPLWQPWGLAQFSTEF